MEKDVKTKRPVGRPKLENTLSTKLPVVRVSIEQLEAYRSASKRDKLNFSVWVRTKLDEASE